MSEGIQLNREDFEAEVKQIMPQEQISFVLAVYRIVDEWTARAIEGGQIQLACRRGCSFCCHQLVTCTNIEWREIRKFLKSIKKRRYSLDNRLRRARLEWREYFRNNQDLLRSNPMKPHDDWQGKPCPFLNQEGLCDIYPVRSIDCRTLSSTETCTNWKKQEGSKRFRFEWELWANNLILEEEKRRTGRMVVIPLPHLISGSTI